MITQLKLWCYETKYWKGRKKIMWKLQNLTTALISHASNILLRILQKRLDTFLIPELPIEQAGFRRGMHL